MKEFINVSPEFIKAIEKSLSSAIGDDIKVDRKINELDTGNSTPTRIWDFINRNIGKNLSDDYIARVTKRGQWEIKPIFEKSTGILYTLMREERFKELKREVAKRTSAHYIQALAEVLNKNIVNPHEQLKLFSVGKGFDEEEVNKVADKIFCDLQIPNNIVERHAIILFSSSSYELVSLRCCMIKSDLSIVVEENWSQYIEVHESVMTQFEVAVEPKQNNPSNGLKLKQKAKDKIGQRKQVEHAKEEKEKQNNE